ncbi:hypothetical protein Enr17x_09340 [Gimesia fumaroli]|uniref:Uncharacterized protein n=1 Tax=Gimesia fumaroli TaxID=2527976 RepID=A0A518I783_9PLAN|nr:hypothetical protein Enr17x_09340 [Gimesia fumaroli]
MRLDPLNLKSNQVVKNKSSSEKVVSLTGCAYQWNQNQMFDQKLFFIK